MRIFAETARYLFAATAALEAGRPVPTTSTCAECKTAPALFDDEHLLYLMPDGTIVVLVGCEGYAHIDPAAIGLPRENWQTIAQCEMGHEPGS